MTRAQLDQVQSIVFTLADGAAVVFPAVGPFVVIVEKIVETAEAHGITPAELPAGQLAAIAAGMAAARASAVTTDRARRKS